MEFRLSYKAETGLREISYKTLSLGAITLFYPDVFMDLAAPKATDAHGSDTYHTLITTLALTSCEPQSQLQKADCCSSAVTCGYKVVFF